MFQCNICNTYIEDQYICNCRNLITSTLGKAGRFGNQLIRNLVVSFIAEKINLYVEYADYNKYDQLGIPLYVGNNIYQETILLTDENCNDILDNPPYANLSASYYYQNEYTSKLIYDFFRKDSIKYSIISKNPYNLRYNNNKDCFVHIRLGDISDSIFNLGLKYYLKAIDIVNDFDYLYIASDSPDHEIINIILDKYKGKSKIFLKDEVETFQFGSTCKNIILSHGTFSSTIGWLAYYSNVYYPAYETQMWHGDVFSVDPSWYKITDYR